MPEPVSPWELLRSERLQDCRVFRVQRDRARSLRSGAEHVFFTLDAPDWVNVVPLTPQDEVVMVRQFRHGSRSTTLEIPGGTVDPGETPAEAARRELREETGYRAEVVERLGVVNPNPALFGNHCHTYVARGARRVGAVRNEGAEETHVELVSLTSIPERMRRGEIRHALVVAAFHWFMLAAPASS